VNVISMNAVVLNIANPVIRESNLPNLHAGLQFFLHSVRKPALDELDGSLQSHGWSDQDVKVFWHQDILVELVSAASIGMQGLEKEVSPLWVSKQLTP